MYLIHLEYTPTLRHCERSEVIHALIQQDGLPRRYAPRNDGRNYGKVRQAASNEDIELARFRRHERRRARGRSGHRPGAPVLDPH